jgi:hypothetical protein
VEADSRSLGSSWPHFAANFLSISLEIKLNIKANLSNGKGDNSIIMEKSGKLSPDHTVNTLS